MSKRRRHRIEHTTAIRFSPIDLVLAEHRDRVVLARIEQGHVLWTEEDKLGLFVRLRFLPSA